MTQYRMLSTPMVHTPGLLAWAMNGYQFEEDREHMLRVMTSTFEAIPPGGDAQTAGGRDPVSGRRRKRHFRG